MTYRRLKAMLSSDAGLSVLLVSLVLVLFVIYPFVELRGPGRVLVSVTLSLILISGCFSLSDRRGLRRIVVGLAILTLLGRWIGHFDGRREIAVATIVTLTAFLALTLAGTLAKVLRSGRITSHRIQGAVAVYLMLGLLFSLLFSLIELRQPGSFHLPGATADAAAAPTRDEKMDDFVYFSFVTLTTLGYGDITPRSAPARNLAIVEALVGQLFIGILIARLVGLQIGQAE